MKQLLHTLGLLLATFLLVACEINIDDTHGKKTDDPYGPQPDPTDRSYGFGEPVEIHNENYDVTFQYKDGTIVIKSQDYQWIDHVEADTIVYFKAGMPAEIRPQVGFPLVLELPEYGWEEILEKVPSGLRNMVLEISEVDGLLRCVTTMAPLSDMYEVFEWEGAFDALENVRSIKLTDDIEVPLEPITLADFGDQEVGEQVITTPWTEGEEQTYNVLRFQTSRGGGTRKTWSDGSSVKHTREPIRMKMVLSTGELLKLIKKAIPMVEQHTGPFAPDELKALIAFASTSDIRYTFYLSCDFYTKGGLKSGTEEHFLEPGIALEKSMEFNPELSGTKELWNLTGEEIKSYFVKTLKKFPIIPRTPSLPLPPIPLPPSPVVINTAFSFRTDVAFHSSSSFKLSMDVFSVDLPIRLSDGKELPTLGSPRFTGPRLTGIDLNGGVGLGIMPELCFSIGINTPPVVHFFATPECDIDLNYLSTSVDMRTLNWTSDAPSLDFKFPLKLRIELSIKKGKPSVLGKEKEYFKYSLPTFTLTLGSVHWPLLPSPSRPKVEATSDPHTFISLYDMDPGLIYKINKLAPLSGVRDFLYKFLGGEEPQAGVLVMQGEKVIGTYLGNSTFDIDKFLVKNELSGLEEGVQYRAVPMMKIKDWIGIGYEFESQLFPNLNGKKRLAKIGEFVAIQYDKQGRPIVLQDLIEGGFHYFTYDAKGAVNGVNYEDDGDFFQSTNVELNERGFITNIYGYYDDGETQNIECTYSSDGYLTHVDNVFGGGDSYHTDYKWKNGQLTRIELTCSDEDDEEDESDSKNTDKYYVNFTYGNQINEREMFTRALCADNNLGCLLMSGLFGKGPSHLPDGAGFSDVALYLPEELKLADRLINTSFISFYFDDDGDIEEELITFMLQGLGQETVQYPYSYATIGPRNSAPSVRKQSVSGTRCLHRSPFRSRRHRR